MEQQTETYQESIFEEIEQQWLYDYASPGQRFVNFLIDTAVLCNFVFSGIIGFAVGVILVLLGYQSFVTDLSSNMFQTYLFNYVVGSVAVILSYTIIEGASRGRTLGKLITKTQVVKEDGSPITFKDAFLRSLCRLVPFEPFSAFSGHPWHDKWTKTVVINKQKSAL